MPLIVEVSARVVLLAAGVALTLAALRIRSPRIAHRAWVGVALALIALPLVVAWGPVVAIPVAGDAPPWMAAAGHGAAWAALPDADAAPRAEVPAAAGAAPANPVRWTSVLLVLYVAGALVLLARIIVGVAQAAALRRHAIVVQGRLTSTRCSTPITVGLCAPAVVLPQEWTSWPEPELAAALAHEEEHARCRDPLATLVTLVARALFWFHPLAWWLPRHVAKLAEHACDAAVLARGHDADVYAASLVKFARAQAHAGGRVAAPGLAMGGLALEQRLRRLHDPMLASTGSARLLAAVTAYAFAVGLGSAGTPVAAMAVVPARGVPQASDDVLEARTAREQSNASLAETVRLEPAPQQVRPPASQPPAARWRTVTTEHFDIYFAGEHAHLTAEVARQAEEAYAELSAAFRYDLPGRVPVALVGGDIEWRDATVTVPASFDGLATDLDCELTMQARVISGTCTAPGTQAKRNLLVVPVHALEPARRLLVHELTHQFAFAIVPEPSRTAPWLIEGLAEHQRGVWDAASVRAVRDAVGSAWVPTVDALASADRYWAHAFFDFIADAYGPEGVRRYLFALRKSPQIGDAIPAAFGTRREDVDRAFRRYVSGRFGTL